VIFGERQTWRRPVGGYDPEATTLGFSLKSFTKITRLTNDIGLGPTPDFSPFSRILTTPEDLMAWTGLDLGLDLGLAIFYQQVMGLENFFLK
jgi:hypothetical protein